MHTDTSSLLDAHTAHNDHPLPVVLARGEGAWVTDVDGTRYLDALAGYSALNFDHRHPDLVRAAHELLDRLTLTSRAFHHDQFADFTTELAALAGKDAVLPMNTGAEAITDDTCAVLLEPIQVEAGVVLPPPGHLAEVRRLCDDRGVPLLADEVQSGLGRTGRTFACDHEDVVPDVYVLGKALGGGIVPVSAIVANRDVMDVFTPGSHGSTFGGLAALPSEAVAGVRTRGLWAGIDVAGDRTGRQVCEDLLTRGVLAKDTHGATIRLAPPLVVTEAEVDLLVDRLGDVLSA